MARLQARSPLAVQSLTDCFPVRDDGADLKSEKEGPGAPAKAEEEEPQENYLYNGTKSTNAEVCQGAG